MWSEVKNCDVKADFPTSEAPSMATRYCLISDGQPMSSRCEFFRDATRDALLEEAAEAPEYSSPELVLELLHVELRRSTLKTKRHRVTVREDSDVKTRKYPRSRYQNPFLLFKQRDISRAIFHLVRLLKVG